MSINVPGLNFKIYSNEIGKYLGEKIWFGGWIHSKRVLGNIAFIILRDKEGTIQATAKKEILEDKYNKIVDIREESVIQVYGIVKEKPKGGYEIIVEDYKVLNVSDPLPIDIWNPNIKTQFIKRVQYRQLDLRKPEIRAVFEIRSKVINYLREFFVSNGFIEFHTPKIVSMGAESGAEVFKVDYYGKEAYLAQSPQLYKQMLLASGIDKVLETGFYWRAEKSHTSRHLSEFYGLDIEIAWIKSHHDVMDLEEQAMYYLFDKLEKNNKELFELLDVDLIKPRKIPRISLQEAYEILRSSGMNIKNGEDLNSEAERMLGEYFLKEYEEPLVFVYNYPWRERPFYHMRLEEDNNWTKSFDLIYKGLEITTGAQREHRYDILIKQAKEKRVPLEPLKYYIEAFRYGMPPHGGFGFGLDRFIKQLLDLRDVREAVLWFRDPEHYLP